MKQETKRAVLDVVKEHQRILCDQFPTKWDNMPEVMKGFDHRIFLTELPDTVIPILEAYPFLKLSYTDGPAFLCESGDMGTVNSRKVSQVKHAEQDLVGTRLSEEDAARKLVEYLGPKIAFEYYRALMIRTKFIDDDRVEYLTDSQLLAIDDGWLIINPADAEVFELNLAPQSLNSYPPHEVYRKPGLDQMGLRVFVDDGVPCGKMIMGTGPAVTVYMYVLAMFGSVFQDSKEHEYFDIIARFGEESHPENVRVLCRKSKMSLWQKIWIWIKGR